MKKFIFLLLSLLVVSFSSKAQFNMKSELKNLGRNVNTAYHEAAPVISPDGKILYFFVTNHPENRFGKEGSQDIWYSELQADGTWGKAVHVDKPLNEHRSNQVFNILADGRILIRGGKSRHSRGFSFTRRTGESFSNPEEIDVEGLNDMNIGKFYGATMSSDGKHMIIYMSERNDWSFSDLYVSHLTENGSYSKPVKLAENINTSRDEFGPFLAPDDKTMYYSSNRKDIEGSVGGADIFMVRRLDDSWQKWSDPVNVGRPINTSAFDAYLSVDKQNNVFVTMSGDVRDGGNLDIFQLIPKEIDILMKGIVVDEETGQPIDAEIIVIKKDTIRATRTGGYQITLPSEGDFGFRVSQKGYKPATYEIFIPEVYNDTTIIKDFMLLPDTKFAYLKGNILDSNTKEQVLAYYSIQHTDEGLFEDQDRSFSRTLQRPGWYYIAVSAEGYLNGADSVFFDGNATRNIDKDIYLTPIEIGTTVRLNHIYFDFDKTTLQTVSFKELDKVVGFLNSNPRVEIEIAGHTDSKGADDYNQNLSQGRAQAVVDYLISQGIDSWRLIARGYGESVPVATNETDEGRAENRRVEFTILNK